MAARKQAASTTENIRGRVVPTGKLQKAAGDARNRRALGDIGNLVKGPVAEGKPLPQPNRRVTRSFGAQLIANAQEKAAAADVAKQKPVDVCVGDGAAKKGGARIAKSRVVPTKPKPEEVVEISPDTNEKVKQKFPKKTVNTLTCVLTARSKAACGINTKPKELVHNIDAADAEDQFAVVDYVEDIYKFYKLFENAKRPLDYMSSQVEINAKMRAILTDWLIEVHHKFELQPETLYLTICVIDRYLSMETVTRRELQLVGLGAMLIACKYEEIWAPEVNDFICISDRAYTREQLLGMEKGILNKLEWFLTFPTPYMFLVRFLKAAMCDNELENMVFFLAELGLMEYKVMISYSPSMFAASAVYTARCTLNKTPYWTETLKHHTGYCEQQLLDCALVLANSHSTAPEGKVQVVYRKYSSKQLGEVAMRSPAIKQLVELRTSTRT